MDVGTTLQKLRFDRRLSQENLADALDVAVSTYQRWEKGLIKDIKLASLAKVADFYDMTLSNLINDMLHETDPKHRLKEENYDQVMVMVPVYMSRKSKEYNDILRMIGINNP